MFLFLLFLIRRLSDSYRFYSLATPIYEFLTLGKRKILSQRMVGKGWIILIQYLPRVAKQLLL